MGRWLPWGVQVQPSGGSLTTIGGVSSQSIDNGIDVQTDITAGQTSPTFGSINKVQPGGKFNCYDISKVMSTIGTRGVCLAGGSGPGFVLYSLSRSDCGTKQSGSVHRKLTIPNGRCVPRTLSVQQDKRASIACEVMSYYDGTNDPLIVATGVAAPTGLEDLIGYHLHSVVVGGVALARVGGLEANFGNEIVAEYDDGEVFPHSLNVNSHAPTLTVNTFDLSKFGSGGIPLRGLAATHADSYFILRRKIIGTAGFSTEADAIKVTFAGMVYVSSQEASGNTPGSMTVNVTTLDDGTNDMFVPDYAFDPNA